MRNSVCAWFSTAGLVVEAIHAEEHGFLHMAGGAQFGEQIVEIFLVGFARVRRRQVVFPQQRSETAGS